MLNFKDFKVFVSKRELFGVADLSLEQGIVALVGRNGSGKSTFFRTLTGGHSNFKGQIEIEGKDIKLYSQLKLAKKIAIVYSKIDFYGTHTGREVLMLGRLPYQNVFSIPSLMDQTVVQEVIDQLKIDAFVDQKFSEMSDGEKQLVMIGRALMQKPKMLLLDEPSLGLAPRIVSDVFRSIAAIHKEGVPVLIVEQNVRQTLEIAHRAYVIENGRVALEGEGKALLEDEHMKRAYLGLH